MASSCSSCSALESGASSRPINCKSIARLHNIEERLARWLLACRDRVESDRLQLTHDFLGQMLGAPRSTVTLAAGLLHKAGMIDYSRGVVTIKNRAELEGAACECYGIVRDEFRRLFLL